MEQFTLGVFVGGMTSLGIAVSVVLLPVAQACADKLRSERISKELRLRREVWEEERAMMKPLWNQKADLGWEDEGWYV